jgi:hypothetical protein
MRRTCRLRPSVIVISKNVLWPESRMRSTTAGRVDAAAQLIELIIGE